MRLVEYLIYLYLLLRPYYLFDSGGIQISDIFLILAFILFLVINKKSSLYEFKKNAMIKNRKFLFFVLISSIINILNCINYPDKRYIMSILYFVFNISAIYLFTFCILVKTTTFANNIKKIFVLNLIIQFVINVLGIGRFWDNTRYMGTFNDPNQFGFYIFLTYCYIYLITANKNNDDKKNTIINVLSLLLSLLLIFKSSSTGMIFGFLVFVIFILFDNLKKPLTFIKNHLKPLIINFIFLTLIITIICISNTNLINKLSDNIFNSSLFSRIIQKVERAFGDSNSGSEGINIWEDRALDYIIYYPQYLIFGSGEGGEDKFPLVSHYTEIHSTFPALLFYYGIIPFSLLISWIWEKIKKIEFKYLIIYIAIIAESFTLANQRQALFWSIFCFAILYKKEK